MQSVPSVSMTWQIRYHETPSACTTIIRWVQAINNLRNVKNRIGLRGTISEYTVQTVISTFCLHPIWCLNKECADLSIPYNTIQKIVHNLGLMFFTIWKEYVIYKKTIMLNTRYF